MSWFDATGLANIAKTALREAQKTIDKALDIREEENDEAVVTDEKSEIYGAGSSYHRTLVDENEVSVTSKSNKEEMVKANAMPSSNWGSFSGSFFQVDKSDKTDEKLLYISTQPQKSPGLPCSEEERFLDFNIDSPTEINKKNSDIVKKFEGDNLSKNVSISHISGNQNKQAVDETSNSLFEEKVITRTRGKQSSSNRNSYVLNRLSVLSTDSDGKKSSESVEVLGSLSCTTSPDTDLPSISASSSMGLPVSSSCTDSVEVIDSLASPSSIEVMVENSGGDQSTQSSKDDCFAKPNSAAVKMVSSPISCISDISPESFEVIPDLPECDEELSVADSYTSASESTGPTILEPSGQYSYRMTESFTDLSQASSKFRSGDSTPDVLTKLPSIHRSSCDIVSESVHEIPGPDFLELNRNSESKKYGDFDYEKSTQKCSTPEEVQGNVPEMRGRSGRTVHESPTKRPLMKLDDRNSRNKFDEAKCSKSDLGKIDLNKGAGFKKEFEEGAGQEVDKIDLSNDEICGSSSSYSDTRTIVANDSSCDEIALESSSEDVGNVSERQENASFRGEKRAHYEGPAHSCYVKNLLTEAIGEVPATRETSPTLSEKSRSDLVKVGSEQTSGHTSGDELETTTSSDIEIISSPNGDSSSTTSRHSPAKHLHNYAKSKLSLVTVDILGKVTQSKTKGHQREPSETSSFCSEDNSSEVEKLSKRVTELTEILEARESRLNDLRKSNLEMQEKNQELRKEMELAKLGISASLSASQSESEKDKLIKELKEEGEKLSKKELKQSTLIKTLRAQEKSQQALIESSKIQIQNLTKSVEELKAELQVKKESEKTLSENVKQMNKKITRQNEEIANLLNQMEKAVVKAEELKILLDSKEAELSKCQELLAAGDFELQDSKAAAELKTKQLERLKTFQESAEIELEDLRQQLKKSEERHFEYEKNSREEKNKLLRRLQEAEARNEELAQNVSKATRPLLRQMEVLQAATAHERETWEKQEKNLLQKLEESESRLSSALYHEKSSKQEILELQSKVSSLEEQLKASSKELATWKSQVTSLSKQVEDLKGALESERLSWEKKREAFQSQIAELNGEIARLEHQLSAERAVVDTERRKAATLQDQLKEKDCQPLNRDSNSPRSSPTLSFGRVSLSESLSSNAWPQFNEDGFDSASVSGKYATVYDNLRGGNTTSLIESLQAQLKMRDGEISLLQWELQRRDTERMTLTTELSALTSKLEEQENKLAQMGATSESLKELQTNYDALLEMYGEKVEEVEELRLDLQDVKEMYKTQIEELLRKDKQSASECQA